MQIDPVDSMQRILSVIDERNLQRYLSIPQPQSFDHLCSMLIDKFNVRSKIKNMLPQMDTDKLQSTQLIEQLPESVAHRIILIIAREFLKRWNSGKISFFSMMEEEDDEIVHDEARDEVEAETKESDSEDNANPVTQLFRQTVDTEFAFLKNSRAMKPPAVDESKFLVLVSDSSNDFTPSLNSSLFTAWEHLAL